MSRYTSDIYPDGELYLENQETTAFRDASSFFIKLKRVIERTSDNSNKELEHITHLILLYEAPELRFSMCKANTFALHFANNGYLDAQLNKSTSNFFYSTKCHRDDASSGIARIRIISSSERTILRRRWNFCQPKFLRQPRNFGLKKSGSLHTAV